MPSENVKSSRLPRRSLPPLAKIAEPDGAHYVKIVRSLADAAIVVVRKDDEIRFLAEFGRPSGIVAIEHHEASGTAKLTYRVADKVSTEIWMEGPDAEVRNVFEQFAGYAGTLKTAPE